MTSRWSRLVPLTGLIAVALLVIAAVVAGETPDPEESAEEVLAFYVEDDSAQVAGSLLAAYGALFLIFFFGALRSRLRREEGATGGLSAVAFGAGLVMAVGILLLAGISFALGDAADSLDPASAQTLHVLNTNLFFPLAIGTAAFLLTSGIAMVRSGDLPSWLGWIAIALGVLAATPIGFFALLGGLVWIVVTSIVLTVRPAAERPAPTV